MDKYAPVAMLFMVMRATDIIRFWSSYIIRILHKMRGWLLSSQKPVWLLTIRYFGGCPLLSSWPRTKIGVYRIYWGATLLTYYSSYHALLFELLLLNMDYSCPRTVCEVRIYMYSVIASPQQACMWVWCKFHEKVSCFGTDRRNIFNIKLFPNYRYALGS